MDFDEMTDDQIEKYFSEMTDDQLVEFIDQMWYYNVIPCAFTELIKREPQRALNMGVDILINDRGDDFLQASIFVGLYLSFDFKKIFYHITQRKALFGWSTLNDILTVIIVQEFRDIFPDLRQLIIDSYNCIKIEKQNEFRSMFNDFLDLTSKG